MNAETIDKPDSPPIDFKKFEIELQDSEDPRELKGMLSKVFSEVTDEHFNFLIKLGGARKLREFYHEVLKFDQYGTQTSQFIPETFYKLEAQHSPDLFANEGVNAVHGVKHRSSLTSSITSALTEALTIFRDRGFDATQVSFYDMGCGTGKPALMAASKIFGQQHGFNFTKVVGVDYYKPVLEIARKNAQAPALDIPPDKISFIFEDAAKFRHFNGVNLVYMYNPFERPIVEKVEANLRRYGGKTILAYNKPLHREVFIEKGWYVEHELGHRRDLTEKWAEDKRTVILSHGFDNSHGHPADPSQS
jgi:SAM-dependent methyltransferase